MLTEKELEAAIKQITDRLDDVNILYVKKIVKQIQKIGEMNASSVHRFLAMLDMGADVREITNQLATATSMNVRDIYMIYQKALTAVYTDPRFKTALKHKSLTPAQNARISQLAQNVSVQTAQNMYNLSNTTSIMPGYKDAVDRAVMAVSAGGVSYTEAARDIIRDVGYVGLQVHYESGYHRRLDTAVRQNIIDGVNQINQHASLAMGEALGYDAVELSAHLNSAPDHEPVQGRVFLLNEFEKMQNGQPFQDVDGRQYEGFRRPIGEWNCMHIAMSFSTQHSVRRYTDEQLEQWKRDNEKGCEINGRHYTNYEARQLMRRLETSIRREKDAAIAAQLNGNDMEARRAHQTTINALTKRYYEIAQASGLSPRPIRMSVEGFQTVKTGEKTLAFVEKSGTIKKGMNRRTGNSGAFSVLPERMSKKRIREIANEYEISLEHVTLNIDYDTEKLNPKFPYAGRADPQSVGRIDFFPNAFRSKEELLRTLYHERIHVFQFREYGAEYVQNNRNYFEMLAYSQENDFITRLKKEGKL